jgi:hypothetical protein
MLGALLSLLLVAERPHAPMALMAEPVALCEGAARLLQPSGSRALLHVGDPPSCDPLVRAGSKMQTLRLDPAHATIEQEAQAVQLIERSQCIVLCGGTWIEWWSLTHEVTRRNRLALALQHAQRSGRGMIGIGAAAEYLCGQALVRRSELHKPSRNPRSSPVLLAGGLALAGDLALCTNRTSFKEFCTASRLAGHSRALLLDGPIACILRPDNGEWQPEGGGRALLLDFCGTQRARARPLTDCEAAQDLLPADPEARWDAANGIWELQYRQPAR